MISITPKWTYVPLANDSFKHRHVTQCWSIRKEEMPGGKGRGREEFFRERLVLIKCPLIIVMFQIIDTI